MLNTSPQLVREGGADEDVEKFAYKMMVSGYNGKERGQIVKEGVARYKNIIMEADKGTRPIYRSAQWNRGKRAIVKWRRGG
mgnify:CR=1 FL=1